MLRSPGKKDATTRNEKEIVPDEDSLISEIWNGRKKREKWWKSYEIKKAHNLKRKKGEGKKNFEFRCHIGNSEKKMFLKCTSFVCFAQRQVNPFDSMIINSFLYILLFYLFYVTSNVVVFTNLCAAKLVQCQRKCIC